MVTRFAKGDYVKAGMRTGRITEIVSDMSAYVQWENDEIALESLAYIKHVIKRPVPRVLSTRNPRKKRWSAKATTACFAALKHLAQARKHLSVLCRELEGRPAYIGSSSSTVLDEIPAEITQARKQITNFWRTHCD